MGGGEWVGREGGGENPQVKTQAHWLPSDGPDHSTRPKRHHSGRGWNSRVVTPNWQAPHVPMCQSMTVMIL